MYAKLYDFFLLGKSHEADVVKEALHKELLALLSKLNQIKALLSSPEIRMKMYKELLVKGLTDGSTWERHTGAESPVS